MAASHPTNRHLGGASAADRGGLRRLYQARYGDLVAMLHAYLGDLTEAQDLAQESFCRAWQQWEKVAGYEDPMAWLRRSR